MVARELINLPADKKLVLFGAINATGDPRKGFKELTDALHLIQIPDLELVVFGASRSHNQPDFGFPAHYLGRLNDDISMRVLYSAADVMVVPSLQENLSNVIMEALACETPVVAFDIGGNPDMIDHKINGYLATPYDPADLACGIEWILNHQDPETLSWKAREKVEREFDSRVVAKRYIELYEEILRQ